MRSKIKSRHPERCCKGGGRRGGGGGGGGGRAGAQFAARPQAEQVNIINRMRNGGRSNETRQELITQTLRQAGFQVDQGGRNRPPEVVGGRVNGMRADQYARSIGIRGTLPGRLDDMETEGTDEL